MSRHKRGRSNSRRRLHTRTLSHLHSHLHTVTFAACNLFWLQQQQRPSLIWVFFVCRFNSARRPPYAHTCACVNVKHVGAFFRPLSPNEKVEEERMQAKQQQSQSQQNIYSVVKQSGQSELPPSVLHMCGWSRITKIQINKVWKRGEEKRATKACGCCNKNAINSCKKTQQLLCTFSALSLSLVVQTKNINKRAC